MTYRSAGRPEGVQRLPTPVSPLPVAARWTVVVDDLVFFEGDAIARPVNETLGATTGVGRKLETAALEGERGARLVRQLQPAEPLAVGAAVVTAAGALRAIMRRR